MFFGCDVGLFGHTLRAFGISLQPSSAHLLVGDNVTDWNVVFFYQRQQIVDSTVDLLVGQRFINSISLKFNTYRERIHIVSAIEIRLSCMPRNLLRAGN